jgi:hypothetical protein
MATANKGFEQPAAGSSNWDVPNNANFGYIDICFGGALALSATSGTTALTQAQCRNIYFNVTGALVGNVTYTIPSGVSGQFIIKNSTTNSYTLTIASAGGGSSVVVDQNKTNIVFSDGTNIISAVSNLFSGGTISGNLNIVSGGLSFSTSAPREDIDLYGSNIAGILHAYSNSNSSALTLSGGAAALNGAWVALYGGSHATNPSVLVFGAGASEFARFNSSGQFTVGRASPFYGGKLQGYWNPTTEQGLVLQSSNETYNNYALLFANSSNTIVGSVVQSTTSVTYNTTSDYRLKFDVEPIGKTFALETVLSLKPVSHSWIIEPTKRSFGFLAHEFIPSGVKGEKDKVDENGEIVPQQIDKAEAIPFLAGAIQALKDEIDDLRLQIAELKWGKR